jgi:outer membrane protein assembly factor BamD (BamD/ComL family)
MKQKIFNRFAKRAVFTFLTAATLFTAPKLFSQNTNLGTMNKGSNINNTVNGTKPVTKMSDEARMTIDGWDTYEENTNQSNFVEDYVKLNGIDFDKALFDNVHVRNVGADSIQEMYVFLFKMDAEYRAAICYYEISPTSSLDQAFTERGIEEFQRFLEKYPDSEYRDSVNGLVDLLHHKLETKSYNNAYLYYKIGEYKAAVSALNNSIEDFPDSPYNEDAMFYIIKSSYSLAEGSVLDKKEQRYKNTIVAYHRLVDDFPETEYMSDAIKIKDKVEKRIKK